jgi:hypothetical protein
MDTAETSQAIVAGARLLITKGCAARELPKGVTVRVLAVEPLGAEYGHSVKVRFQPVNGFKTNQTFAFYARHTNRLADPIVRMNDGRPEHTIEVRRASR